MGEGATERVFRVTLRGRFDLLSESARRYLVGAQREHDIFESAYTVEGTFTYDGKIDFFNLRYEVRAEGEAAAAGTAVAEAEAFLRTMGFGFRGLATSVVDMSAMWAGVERRRPATRPDA